MMKLVAVLAVLVAAVSAEPQAIIRPVATQYTTNHEVPILRQESDIAPDGTYSYAYETGNGIAAQEQGIGGQQAQGNFQWTSPEGVPIAIQYTADENGYQAVGDAVHPIPPQIQRALAWIAAHPQQPDTRRVIIQ